MIDETLAAAIAALPDGDRQEVELFVRFLAGELAYDNVNHEYVPVDQAHREGVVWAGNPEGGGRP